MTDHPEGAIYELLKNEAGGKVYAMFAPQDTAAPFVIFQRQSGERWRSLEGQSGLAQVEIQIDSYAGDFYSMRDLADSIETILDGYRATVYYGSNSPQNSIRIANISLQSESDIFDQTDEPFLFRNSAVYLVTFEK